MLTFLYLLATIWCMNVQPSVIEYAEDVYLMPAPAELLNEVQAAAELVGFEGDYQVVVPKKAGMEINPWNQLVSYGINPQNQLPFMVINPSWFDSLSKDERTFWLSRCFVAFQQRTTVAARSVKLFPYLWLFLVFLVFIALILGLKRTRLGAHKLWVRILVVYIFIFICNITFLNNVQLKMTAYLAKQYDNGVHLAVIEKTGNREAAISALERIDASIKESAQTNAFWAPHVDLFASYVQDLR